MQPPSQRFGKYELHELLGNGATAEVWKALDTQLGRYVAIKVLHTDQQADKETLERFLREAQGAAALRHPNIVQIHDFQVISTDPAQAYIVMDYIEGPTLRDYIRGTTAVAKFLPPHELVQLFTSICLAVDYAHQHKMIHRDLKPANILLDRRNTTHNPMGEPMLTDFGLVKMMNATSTTRTGTILGTPLYMSPEQAQGLPGNEASDIYSLGIILYELCTGTTPFSGSSEYVVFLKHVNETPTSPAQLNPRISPALEAVILRSLTKNPSERYSRAIHIATALAEAFNITAPKELEISGQTTNHISSPPMPVSPVESIPSARSTPSTPPVPILESPRTPFHTSLHADSNPSNPSRGLLTPTTGAFTVSSSPTFLTTPSLLSTSARTSKRQRARLVLLVLLLIALVGSILGGAFLVFRPHATPPSTAQPVRKATFFSSEQLDAQGNSALNDGLQIILQGTAQPASGNSLYAWLRSSKQDDQPLFLGQLQVHGDIASLQYIDAQHRNLLGPIAQGGKAFYTDFIVREEQIADTPSLEQQGVTRYHATLPQNKSATDNFSYTDHIHHLLSFDPTLEALHLSNGIDFHILKNIDELYKQAKDIKLHTSSLAFVRQQITNSIYHLRGQCAPQDLAKGVPETPTKPADSIVDDVKISLLDCSQVSLRAYMTHISIHASGIAQAPDVTPEQRQTAKQVSVYLAQITQWLKRVLDDSLKLITISDLNSQTGRDLRNDMVIYARSALTGRVNPETQQIEPGITQVTDYIQTLADFHVVVS